MSYSGASRKSFRPRHVTWAGRSRWLCWRSWSRPKFRAEAYHRRSKARIRPRHFWSFSPVDRSIPLSGRSVEAPDAQPDHRQQQQKRHALPEQQRIALDQRRAGLAQECLVRMAQVVARIRTAPRSAVSGSGCTALRSAPSIQAGISRSSSSTDGIRSLPLRRRVRAFGDFARRRAAGRTASGRR